MFTVLNSFHEFPTDSQSSCTLAVLTNETESQCSTERPQPVVSAIPVLPFFQGQEKKARADSFGIRSTEQLLVSRSHPRISVRTRHLTRAATCGSRPAPLQPHTFLKGGLGPVCRSATATAEDFRHAEAPHWRKRDQVTHTQHLSKEFRRSPQQVPCSYPASSSSGIQVLPRASAYRGPQRFTPSVTA